MVCLPLDYIAGFLFGVNADRVKPELRERVILYQRECYRVLADAFFARGISVQPADYHISRRKVVDTGMAFSPAPNNA
jgi:hypothetical protein